jgi:hypothetical protein
LVNETYYGLATVDGKPSQVLYEKAKIVSHIGDLQIDSCEFYLKGTMMLADTTDPDGMRTKQCFSRTDKLERAHVLQYRDPNDNKVYFIDSVDTINCKKGILYVYVRTPKTPPTRELKNIPFGWFIL